MTRERWSQIKLLFFTSIEDPEQHNSQWLWAKCGDDAALLEEVSRLLKNHRSLGLADQKADAQQHDPFASGGRFELERMIGSGGFGDVYVAYDRRREERVAIKRLRA